MKKVFISSTLRTEWNRKYNKRLCDNIESRGIGCFLPQRDADPSSPEQIYLTNKKGIDNSEVVLSVVINESPNVGWEAGYAYGTNKKIVLITTNDHVMPEMLARMNGKVEKVIVDNPDTIDSYLDELIEKLQ